MPASYIKRMAASVESDLEAMQEFSQAVAGHECDSLWVSRGDLVTAFIARFCVLHSDPPASPNGTIHITNAVSMREALKGDVFPIGVAHVGNT